MFKRISTLIIVTIFTVTVLTGCGSKTGETSNTTEDNISETTSEATSEATEEKSTDAAGAIKIIYTNDIHSYIYNEIDDGEGNKSEGLRLSKIKAMADDMRAAGDEVILADAGDEVQGNIYGSMSEGEAIVKLMNATGYQVATPGNHEFDYGMFQFMKLIDMAEYQFLSCNFKSLTTKEAVMPDRIIIPVGDKNVAFIGITTPESITSSTPIYFQNEKGEFIYTIDGLENKEDIYASVQNSIDNARECADYVIALGHLGVGFESKEKGLSSEDVIANTEGLDAFIDGHSHTLIEGTHIKDKSGKEVILTQTGSYLNAVGIMEIAPDGSISTKMVDNYERSDETVAKMEQELYDEINNELSKKIAELPNPLYVLNPDDRNQRLIRAMELNAGDFAADASYWFFNEKLGINCDVAIANGGGIRAQLESGDITYMSAMSVNPFINQICLIYATGQEIMNCLEMGVTLIGEWDDEWNAPKENGGFMHVAGIRYTVDSTIPSSVKTDANGMFEAVEGDYRVKDVMVYDKAKKDYVPLELDKEYTIGGINYILRNGGNGCSMFMDNNQVVDFVGRDCDILAEYFKSFKADGEFPKVTTNNSPLSAYENYAIDYENPYGAGRISIIME